MQVVKVVPGFSAEVSFGRQNAQLDEGIVTPVQVVSYGISMKQDVLVNHTRLP